MKSSLYAGTSSFSGHYSLGNNMLVSGNQQATISWFAGILEGKGRFHRDKKNNILVDITNTDKDIVSCCENWLKLKNIWYVKNTTPQRLLYTLRITNVDKEIFQYVTLLFESIESKLECRRSEFSKLIGAPETTREPSIDLDWLVGIFEAEGSLYLHLDARHLAILKCSINTTNIEILNKVRLNLDHFGCGYRVQDIKKTSKKHSQAWDIKIVGMLRCQRFLKLMEGKWFATQNIRRASAMLEYIDLRLSHPSKDSYTERELQLIQTVTDLNS